MATDTLSVPFLEAVLEGEEEVFHALIILVGVGWRRMVVVRCAGGEDSSFFSVCVWLFFLLLGGCLSPMNYMYVYVCKGDESWKSGIIFEVSMCPSCVCVLFLSSSKEHGKGTTWRAMGEPQRG